MTDDATVTWPVAGEVIATLGTVRSILIGPTLSKLSTLPALSMHSPSLVTVVPIVSAVRFRLSPATVSVSMPDWTEPVSRR